MKTRKLTTIFVQTQLCFKVYMPTKFIIQHGTKIINFVTNLIFLAVAGFSLPVALIDFKEIKLLKVSPWDTIKDTAMYCADTTYRYK